MTESASRTHPAAGLKLSSKLSCVLTSCMMRSACFTGAAVRVFAALLALLAAEPHNCRAEAATYRMVLLQQSQHACPCTTERPLPVAGRSQGQHQWCPAAIQAGAHQHLTTPGPWGSAQGHLRGRCPSCTHLHQQGTQKGLNQRFVTETRPTTTSAVKLPGTSACGVHGGR